MLYEVTPPLTTEGLVSILQDVKNSIPASEFSRRHHILGCLLSLIDFSAREKQTENFSMSVGKYDPYFNPKCANVGLSFNEKNIAVKIRVRGGYGEAFRKRYMATQMGIARIDWRSKSAKLVVNWGGKVSGWTGTGMTLVGQGLPNPIIGKVVELGGEILKEIGGAAEEHRKEKDETRSQRYSARLSMMNLSPADVLELIPESDQDKIAMLASGEMATAAAQLFVALDADKSGAMELNEFSELFCTLFQYEKTVVQELFYRTSAGKRALSKDDFICLFLELVRPKDSGLPNDTGRQVVSPTNSDSEEAGEDTLTAPQPRNLDSARSLILSFFKLPPETARRLLDNSTDFLNFTNHIFQVIDEDESGSVDRREFEQFFCGALGMSTEVCRRQFDVAFGSAQKEVSCLAFAVFLQSFLSARIAKEVRVLFWSARVNKWLHLSSAQELSRRGSPASFLSVARNCLECLHTEGLSKTQMRLLDEDLISATQCRINEDPDQRFQNLAVLVNSQPLITAERYALVVEAAFTHVVQFKEDWDLVLHEEGQARRIRNDTAALVNRYILLIAHFQDSLLRLARACPLLRSILSAHPEPLSVQELAGLAAQTIERSRNQGLASYTRELFEGLASLSEVDIAVVLEQEYRLDYIALSVFWMVHPYQASHPRSTFEWYAGSLAQAFGLSQQAIASLFDLFQSQGAISPRQLVLILKDCLGTKIQAN